MDAAAKAQYVTEKLAAYANQPDAELWLIIWIASSVGILDIVLLVYYWIKAHKKSEWTNSSDSSTDIRQ